MLNGEQDLKDSFARKKRLSKDAKAYARLFAENEVDFDGLFLLQNAHLKELGIVKLGIRNKILYGIAGLCMRTFAYDALTSPFPEPIRIYDWTIFVKCLFSPVHSHACMLVCVTA